MGFMKRLGIIAAGHSTKEGADWLFDYFIYPLVTAGCLVLAGYLFGADKATTIGPLLSIAVMIPVTGLINYGYLRVYDNVRLDAFGAEFLKRLRHIKLHGLVGTIVNPLIWLLDWTLVLLIACFEDSFLATVYARKGVETYNGLNRRDWIIFLVTTVISNVFWVYLVTAVYMYSMKLASFVYERTPEPLRQVIDSVSHFLATVLESIADQIGNFIGSIPL